MLNEIKRYTHTNSSSYGVESPQEAFNNEQRYLRKKRICDATTLREDKDISIDTVISNIDIIIKAVIMADKQISTDNRDFILLNNIKENELNLRS